MASPANSISAAADADDVPFSRMASRDDDDDDDDDDDNDDDNDDDVDDLGRLHSVTILSARFDDDDDNDGVE